MVDNQFVPILEQMIALNDRLLIFFVPERTVS